MLLLVATAIGAGFAGASWPGFWPGGIAISGNRSVPNAEIAAAAQIPLYRNIWLLDTHAAARRVEAIPDIDRARIERIPPNHLRIVVTERTPFANVRDDRGDVVRVDRSLRVLSPGAPSGPLPSILLRRPTLPPPGTHLDGDAAALRDDALALAAAGIAIASLRFDRFHELEATTTDGMNLLLGDDANLAGAIPLVKPIRAKVLLEGRPVKAIDLRAPRTPVVVYR